MAGTRSRNRRHDRVRYHRGGNGRRVRDRRPQCEDGLSRARARENVSRRADGGGRGPRAIREKRPSRRALVQGTPMAEGCAHSRTIDNPIEGAHGVSRPQIVQKLK